MSINKFEEIESWIAARELTSQIYHITASNNFNKDFGLRDQIQRASVSIMSNIAEGFDSRSDKNFINFLNYSYRSCSEVQSLLYVALDLKYIDQNKFEELYSECGRIHGLIGGMIKYLKSSSK